jgi:hypothetical protein
MWWDVLSIDPLGTLASIEVEFTYPNQPGLSISGMLNGTAFSLPITVGNVGQTVWITAAIPRTSTVRKQLIPLMLDNSLDFTPINQVKTWVPFQVNTTGRSFSPQSLERFVWNTLGMVGNQIPPNVAMIYDGDGGWTSRGSGDLRNEYRMISCDVPLSDWFFSGPSSLSDYPVVNIRYSGDMRISDQLATWNTPNSYHENEYDADPDKIGWTSYQCTNPATGVSPPKVRLFLRRNTDLTDQMQIQSLFMI